MADAGGSKRGTIIIQIVIVVLVCLGVVAVAAAFGVFTPKKEAHNITLRMENTSGSMQIVYSVPGDTVNSPMTVGSSWEKTYYIKSGSEVFVSGASLQRSGDIRCMIYLDGKVWKSQTAHYPEDKAACAGIVP